jgi:hypothetical protein
MDDLIDGLELTDDSLPGTKAFTEKLLDYVYLGPLDRFVSRPLDVLYYSDDRRFFAHTARTAELTGLQRRHWAQLTSAKCVDAYKFVTTAIEVLDEDRLTNGRLSALRAQRARCAAEFFCAQARRLAFISAIKTGNNGCPARSLHILRHQGLD